MEETEEKNTTLDQVKEAGFSPTRMTSVNFDAKLHTLARINNISYRDAIEFGIEFLMSDIKGAGYPPCNLLKKIGRMSDLLNEKCLEIENLRERFKDQLELDKKEEIKKELEQAGLE